MKRIFSIIFLLFLCFHTSLMAQRTMNTLNNQFGSSANGLDRNQYDRNGNPIDTTAVVDANTIPIGLYSWKVDSRFGNVTYIPRYKIPMANIFSYPMIKLDMSLIQLPGKFGLPPPLTHLF